MLSIPATIHSANLHETKPPLWKRKLLFLLTVMFSAAGMLIKLFVLYSKQTAIRVLCWPHKENTKPGPATSRMEFGEDQIESNALYNMSARILLTHGLSHQIHLRILEKVNQMSVVKHTARPGEQQWTGNQNHQREVSGQALDQLYTNHLEIC